MVLFCCTGELGSGKTLTLTFLAWKNWFYRKKKIFSNYHLYRIPYIFIDSVEKLEEMRQGFFCADEFWLWVDCLPISSNIMTYNGIEKCDDAFFKNPFLSVNLNSGNVESSIPIAQAKRLPTLNERLIKITTRTREITASKNHKFFTINRDPNFWNRHKNENPLKFIKEKRAEEFKKNDRILMVSRLPEPKEELINWKVAQLIGYILADGNIEYPHRNAIHIDDSSKECLKKYKKIAEELGFTTSVHKHRESNCYRLRIFGRGKILELMNDIYSCIFLDKGLKCPTSKMISIPEKIIKSNNKVLGAFLRGFFDGEAYVKIEKGSIKCGLIRLVNKNKDMIEKIKYLLLRFGIDSSRVFKRRYKYVWYEIVIKDSLSLRLFKKYIGFSHPQKKLLLKFLPNYKTKRKIYKDIEIGYVTKIEEVEPDEYLVDFSVPEYGNYIANGFIVHNSRCSGSVRNKIVTNILLKSRKRDLTYAYTSQTLEQLDKRVRKIQDFTATPMLNVGETICKVLVFRTGYPKAGNYMRTFYFKTPLIFQCYDHREEVQALGEGETNSQIIFQENKDSRPIIFNTWEEADKYGESWWLKEYRQLRGLL